MYISHYRLFLVLTFFKVVLAIPLGIEYDKTDNLNVQEVENKARLDKATEDANAQIRKMREGFDKHRQGDAKATELFHAAFGKKSKEHKVDKAITDLETGTLKAKLATEALDPGTIAEVEWKPSQADSKTTKWLPQPAVFGASFHGQGDRPLDNNGRTGTLIHEATHQLSATGDEMSTENKIIRPDKESWPASKGKYGYTTNANMHKTVAEINADTGYTGVRDKAKNMEANAESYALLASLCSQPGALGQRDVHRWNRALQAGDHGKLIYLARRNSCKLPTKKSAPVTQTTVKKSSGPTNSTAKSTSLQGKVPASKNATTSNTSPVKKTTQTSVKVPPGPKRKPSAMTGTRNTPAERKAAAAASKKLPIATPSVAKLTLLHGKAPAPNAGTGRVIATNTPAGKKDSQRLAKGAPTKATPKPKPSATSRPHVTNSKPMATRKGRVAVATPNKPGSRPPVQPPTKPLGVPHPAGKSPLSTPPSNKKPIPTPPSNKRRPLTPPLNKKPPPGSGRGGAAANVAIKKHR